MDPIAAFGAVKSGISTLSNLIQGIREARMNSAVSLPEYLKTTSIMSQVYISEDMCEEDIMVPLMGMLNQVYAGYIFTALQMSQYVSSSKTVRNILDFVSTEDYDDGIDDIMKNFGGKKMVLAEESSGKAFGVVDLDSREQKLLSGRLLELTLQVPSMSTSTTTGARTGEKGMDYNTSQTVTSDTKNLTLSLLVQLIPRIITMSVSKEFLGLNFVLPSSLRFKQWRAGQITLMDYFKERDLLANQAKALKEDRTGMLYDMIKKTRNNLSKALLSRTGLFPRNVNSANTIMIISQNVYDEVNMSRGFDMSQKKMREEFFRESMMMLLVVVDPMYQKITIYFNGVDQRGEYSFKMIESNSGSGAGGHDKYNLKDIMSALGNGMVPHFR